MSFNNIDNTNGIILINNEHNVTYNSLNNNTIIEGTNELSQYTISGNIYTITIPNTSQCNSNFPVLVVNGESKKCMSYRIPACPINIISIRSNNNTIFETDINIRIPNVYSYATNIISANVFLTIHWKWRKLRYQIKEVSHTTGSGFIDFNITLYGRFKESLNNFHKFMPNGTIVDIEIVNPTISNIDIEEDSYIFTYNNNYIDKIIYKCPYSSLDNEPLDFKLANKGLLVIIENCSNLTIKGITFRNNGIKDVLVGGHTQGEEDTTPCILISNSSNITIEDCEFSGIFGYCVKVGGTLDETISNDSRSNIPTLSNISIQNNYVHDCFGGGFLLQECNYCTINNNLLKNYGLFQGAAIGIMLKHPANNNTISHNTIHDGLYSGISLGWRWCYINEDSESQIHGTCKNNTISYNHVHHCMKQTSSDGGGIYLLGVDEGTLVKNNIIHDIISQNSIQGSAIYLDQSSSYVKCRNNICYGCDNSILIHYGYANIINNNIFAYSNTNSFVYVKQQGPYSGSVASETATYLQKLKQLACFMVNNIFVIDSGNLMNIVNDGVYLFVKNLICKDGVSTQIFDSTYDVKLTENIYGSSNKIIGTNGIINLTMYGIRFNNTSLSEFSICGFPIFTRNSPIGFKTFDLLESPDLCGVQNTTLQDYDLDTINQENFEEQRLNVVQNVEKHSISYFETI